eukprot:829522-Rhodomonas_salina.2
MLAGLRCRLAAGREGSMAKRERGIEGASERAREAHLIPDLETVDRGQDVFGVFFLGAPRESETGFAQRARWPTAEDTRTMSSSLNRSKPASEHRIDFALAGTGCNVSSGTCIACEQGKSIPV